MRYNYRWSVGVDFLFLFVVVIFLMMRLEIIKFSVVDESRGDV